MFSGFRATPDIVRVRREHNMLAEYRDRLAFYRKVDKLRQASQPVTDLAETRMAIAAK